MQFLLAKHWDVNVNPTGWWVSEKMDGIRAGWTGSELITRNGNKIYAPDWFVSQLPANCTLDGELWIARKQFQRAMSIVRRQTPGPEWSEISYCVYDSPLAGGTFENRISHVKNILQGNKVAVVLNQQPCQGAIHLKVLLHQFISSGAEGLMLRQPQSKYEGKRSSTLLKVKKFFDEEGTVIDLTEGEGRNKGLLGALVIRSHTGTVFNVGSGLSDYDRRNPPKVGDVVTYRFTELTDAGCPKCASFVSVRADV